jgi:hypothetical protein
VRLRTATIVALTAIALAAGAGAGPALADCGGVQTAKASPKKRHHYRAPLAIGDSTMLLALPSLAREGYYVNAHGCRGWDEGLGVLRDRRHAGTLPHLVVMALGTDYSVTPGGVRKALHILGPDRILGLVTPLELGGVAGSDAQVVRDEGRRRPKHVKVLDWVAYSRGHGGWFQPDGCHLTFSGARAFARFFKGLLRYAAPPKPAPPPQPPPPAPTPPAQPAP